MTTWALNCTASLQVNLKAQCFLLCGIKLRKKVKLYCEFQV